MFIIVLEKAGATKVYSQLFASKAEALAKLNDFKPDFTGYVLATQEA